MRDLLPAVRRYQDDDPEPRVGRRLNALRSDLRNKPRREAFPRVLRT